MFCVQCWRRAPKPACISAQTLRARARAAVSAGQSCFSGYCSDTYSAIASVSQMTRSPSCSTGTLPAGLRPVMVCLNCELASKESKRTRTSSKGMPAWRMSTQGRMDQEE